MTKEMLGGLISYERERKIVKKKCSFAATLLFGLERNRRFALYYKLYGSALYFSIIALHLSYGFNKSLIEASWFNVSMM